VEEHKTVQIEIKEELYTQPHYAKHGREHGRDAMGRFIVEDGLSRMMPTPKLNIKKSGSVYAWKCLIDLRSNWQAVGEAKSAAQKRTEQQENAKKAAEKTQAKAVMDSNRQARRRVKRKFLLGLTSSRRQAISEEEQNLRT
jgi:hypothetical protein